ncbi:LysR substrate-binding domain-containing protein [Allokutzneria multivorans]|uniref:LysR substrate-binding domain-containing protein n=1 Tax=Allokutzneria multivorans TaxID=1142134 RepID=UPI003CD09ACE
MTGSEFLLGYVPGVVPTKWLRMWVERLPEVRLTLVAVSAQDAAEAVRRREADAVLLRTFVGGEDLHTIPLYTETTVVVMQKEHVLAAADELSAEDLAETTVLHPLDDTLGWERPPGLAGWDRPESTEDAIRFAAAGVGVLVVPQSLARLHHRRDLTYRPLVGAPESSVGLSWLREGGPELIEELIGIVRGRTANSTRGRQQEAPAKQAPVKKKQPAATQKQAPRKPQQQRKPVTKGRKPRR